MRGEWRSMNNMLYILMISLKFNKETRVDNPRM